MLPATDPVTPIGPPTDDLGGPRPPHLGGFAPLDMLTPDALRDATYPDGPPPPAPMAALPGFDPMAIVRDRPWVSVGIAAALGLGIGLVLFRRPKRPPAGEAPVDEQGRGPSLFDTLLSGIGSELMTVGKQAVEELTEAVKEKAQSTVAHLGDVVAGTGVEPEPTPPAATV